MKELKPCPNCGARMDGGDFDEMPNIKSKE